MIHMQKMLNGAEKYAQRNGLELISPWFEDLPQAIQAELAAFISTMLPELVATGAEDDAVPLVRRALQADVSPVVRVARAAAFSAAIDVIFLQRSTQKAWVLYENFLKQFRDAALADGKKNAASLVHSMIDALPARSALWIHEAQRWSLLRSQMGPELRAGNYAAVMAMT